MSNLIVRKARKDYVCDCCGHIIKAGTEYIDNVVIKHGSVVKHERYHDECPDCGDAMRLFKKIVAADGDLLCSTPDGNKWTIKGVCFVNNEPHVNCVPWAGGKWLYKSFAEIKDWIDEHGERILSKV